MSEPQPDDPHLLDFYKLAVDMADRVSARRAGANSFFVTVQSAVVASLGFLAAQEPAAPNGILLAVCGVGILGAGVWFLLLRSYRHLNRAKFDVILALETRLPVQLFADEWASLKKDPVSRWRGRYAELGTVERLAPLLFAALNLATAVYLVVR